MKRLLLIGLLISLSFHLEGQVLLKYELAGDSIKKVNFTVLQDSGKWITTTEFVLPNIFFDLGKYSLMPQSFFVLDQLVEFLTLHPKLLIEVSNHRDCRGSDKSSSNLTQRRAQSVFDYLVSKGIDRRRIVAKGYGDIKPLIVDGITLSCEFISSFENDKLTLERLHKLNRRTEFKILSTDFTE